MQCMGRTRELTDDERRERDNAYHREYYAKHREEISERRRAYRQTEQYAEWYRQYYAANRERLRAQAKANRIKRYMAAMAEERKKINE